MVTIKKISLVDQVYESLKNRIIKMEIPLGTKLTVIKLQEEYNVSSTPVREALNRLMNEGLIDFENNVGAKVIDITEKDVKELQELSAAYEMAAAYFAMENTDHEIMADEINCYIEEYRESTEIAESCKCIRNIKNIFYKYAKNQRLIDISASLSGIDGILHNLFVLPYAGNRDNDVYLSGIVYFERIHDAVKKGDFTEVCNGLRDHRVWSRNYILKNLEYIKNM